MVSGCQMQNFTNLYNVQIINGNYCCCHDNEICSSNFDYLLASCADPSTTQVCETYFLVQIRNCLSISTCSLSKSYQLNYKFSASTFDNSILSTPFMDMELNDKVRKKVSYLFKLKGQSLESLQSTLKLLEVYVQIVQY